MTHDDVADTLDPSRADIRTRNLARYLATVSLAELAHLVSAIAGECGFRGIQVAEPLGLAAARIEFWAETEG